MNNKSNFDFIGTFPPLGHPEHHFNRYPDHPWLKSKYEIKSAIPNLIKNTYQYNYIINEDLTVSFISGYCIEINEKGLKDYDGYLPFQVRFCENEFNANRMRLKSIIGTPYVAKYISLQGNLIESFNGLSGNIEEIVYLNDNSIKDFNGMPKIVNSEGISISPNPIESWDGFTNIKAISWWEDEEISDKGYELLLNAPDGLGDIVMFLKEKDERIRFKEINDNDFHVDMMWLRDYQKSKNLNNTLKNNLNKEDKNKKRKL